MVHVFAKRPRAILTLAVALVFVNHEVNVIGIKPPRAHQVPDHVARLVAKEKPIYHNHPNVTSVTKHQPRGHKGHNHPVQS